MNKRITLFLSFLFIALIATVSCNKDNYNDNNNNADVPTRFVTFRLTTDAGNYDAVNLDIQNLQLTTIHNTTINITPATPGVYNLMSFKNGLDMLLAEGNIPAETITKVRIVLGGNNSIVVNGTSHPLTIPASSDGGIDIVLNQSFTAVGSYKIWLALDVARSVQMTGDNSYQFNTVARTYSDLTNGVLTGFVFPQHLKNTIIYAISDANDTFTASPVDTGSFSINGLARHNYAIYIHDNTNTYQDYLQRNIGVIYDIPTNVGNITLQPK